MPTQLKGQIERITYTNAENGFTIARLNPFDRTDQVTVVGTLVAPSPGEVLAMEGEWSTHPKYGEQFKITHCRTEIPATVYGMEKYLGSGLIKGIGPVMAKRIVKRFGTQTLDIIEHAAQRLGEVPGIGDKRIDMIAKAWEDQREIREVMLFLHGHGISSAYATKIFKAYGQRAIQVVAQDPYRLATDIFGIGFVTADRIGMKLGFDKTAEKRIRAGILYILNQLAEEGHTYFPLTALKEKCSHTLDVPADLVHKALDALRHEQRIIVEAADTEPGQDGDAHARVYLTQFHVSEGGIAARIRDVLNTPTSIRPIDSDRAISWVQQKLTLTLAKNQVRAVQSATQSKILIITGGPGTGKTTIISAILRIFSKIKARIMMTAPTGRAAKQMTETTGHDAKTIHRLLEYSIQAGGFQKNESKPLLCDLLIVDELSMIDTTLMYHLLKAVPPQATLILVGDMHQLPSVGPGNVLKDLIDSRTIPVVILNEIFRQAGDSRIITNAHRINHGEMPLLPRGAEKSDFYFIEREDPGDVLDTVLELATHRVPVRFNLDPIDDIQVITPMHKGVVGAGNLNKALQQLLNPSGLSLTRGGHTLRIQDKVMQIKNNYDKMVFNGDMGRIARIDTEMQEVTITFDDRDVSYDYPALDQIMLAYAISVHKSQGSEYQAVILPVVSQHYVLLQRNLIYTAVTRGKRLVIMVGSPKALAIAVKNDRARVRYTHLKERVMAIKRPDSQGSGERGSHP